MTGLRHAILALSALPGLALAGCGSVAHPAGTVTGKITVFAAASLTGSFTDLGKAFDSAHPGTTVAFSFGASSTLAMQITSGAPADVFASASAKNLDTVVAAGAAAAPRTFATNSAEVAVAPASRTSVTSLADLGKVGVKVALCQPEVPCGALATSVLGHAGVQVTPVTRGLDVKAVLASVTSGEVDAGIVYVTDVLAAGAKVVGVTIPAGQNSSTAYPIATVTSSRNPLLAKAFDDFVLSPDGEAVLARAGFGKP